MSDQMQQSTQLLQRGITSQNQHNSKLNSTRQIQILQSNSLAEIKQESQKTQKFSDTPHWESKVSQLNEWLISSQKPYQSQNNKTLNSQDYRSGSKERSGGHRHRSANFPNENQHQPNNQQSFRSEVEMNHGNIQMNLIRDNSVVVAQSQPILYSQNSQVQVSQLEQDGDLKKFKLQERYATQKTGNQIRKWKNNRNQRKRNAKHLYNQQENDFNYRPQRRQYTEKLWKDSDRKRQSKNWKKSGHRKHYIMIRPQAPHNTTQYLTYNYNCRNSCMGTTFRSNISLQKRSLLSRKSWANEEEEKEELSQYKENQINLEDAQWRKVYFQQQNDFSQQSTTAGETSSDEDFAEQRLSKLGLTMQGMIEEDMFDIILDDDYGTEENQESLFQSNYSNQNNLDIDDLQELQNIVESNNLLIDQLIKESNIKKQLIDSKTNRIL